jgi:thiosulfate/3-mercaptopyruvate sulfurtransferase
MQASISTEELTEQLDSHDVIIADIRPAAAYNGWRLQGEARGGHIHGAVSFPLSWTKLVEGQDLIALLASKGIAPDQRVVVYGYAAEESATMAEILGDSSFTSVLTCNSFLAKWAVNVELPMSRLARYEKLVHPRWVRRLISGRKPETYRGKGHVLLDVTSQGPELYRAGHIPTAQFLDSGALEEEPLWNRVPDERLEQILLAQGITRDTAVVLYGRETAVAARIACVLLYAGVEDVRLLNGGFGAWTRAGYEVDTATRQPIPAHNFGGSIPAHPEFIVDTPEVRALLARNEAQLVSVRSWAEYSGETSGYSFVKRAGHIPGAIWGRSGSDPQHMQDCTNIDDTMRNYEEIASIWREAGVDPHTRLIFYCGTGWRASQAFFCAYLMGWSNIAVYDGGWFEWSRAKYSPSCGTVV